MSSALGAAKSGAGEPGRRDDAGTCPSCNAAPCSAVGEIPDSSRFAGTVLDSPLPGGTLYECPACHLWFRAPRIGKEVLDSLYGRASDEAWATDTEERTDWRLVRETVRRLLPEGGRVLDVGCFDGRFLESLGPGYSWSGLELNSAAADRAVARGVALVGRDFAALDACTGRFDAIVAIDVIEHSADPLAFVRSCRALLAPGGWLVLTTGCTDAWTWRMMGGRYWYCANPEHVSFINRRWIQRAARELGLDTVLASPFAHDASVRAGVVQATLNASYRLAPSLVKAVRRLAARDPRTRRDPALLSSPPSWSTARDHVLVAWRLPALRERG